MNRNPRCHMPFTIVPSRSNSPGLVAALRGYQECRSLSRSGPGDSGQEVKMPRDGSPPTLAPKWADPRLPWQQIKPGQKLDSSSKANLRLLQVPALSLCTFQRTKVHLGV